VNIDTGGLAARRMLKRMRRNESAPVNATHGPVGTAAAEAAAGS